MSMFSTIWAFLRTPEGANATIAISSIILMLTTIVYAILTAKLAKENRLLREAGIEPQVIAYLLPHPRIHGPLQFILANVGQGPAFSVRYRMIGGGADFKAHAAALPLPTIPLTVLPQGDRYESYFGMTWDMFTEPRLRPFSLEVTYLDIKKRVHRGVFVIDINQFDGRVKINDDPHGDLLNVAKEMVSEMKRWNGRA